MISQYLQEDAIHYRLFTQLLTLTVKENNICLFDDRDNIIFKSSQIIKQHIIDSKCNNSDLISSLKKWNANFKDIFTEDGASEPNELVFLI